MEGECVCVCVCVCERERERERETERGGGERESCLVLGRTGSETGLLLHVEILFENNFADRGLATFQGFVWLENPS